MLSRLASKAAYALEHSLEGRRITVGSKEEETLLRYITDYVRPSDPADLKALMKASWADADASGTTGSHQHDALGLADPCPPQSSIVDPVLVWGVLFAPLSMAETIRSIGTLIEAGRPAFFVTANVHYVMLTDQNPDLRAINARAAFILADGAPLVWASRWMGSPLPERVAGADLVFELSAYAASNGYRLFFLGGAEGVAEEAAHRLRVRYPGLQVVGTECPVLHELTRDEEAALIGRIRAARPHVLVVALGQPKGERWIAQHLEELDVPVSVQVGAALDFAAGRRRRAPVWMQDSGLEWTFRLGLEPRRLLARYAWNAWFLARMISRDLKYNLLDGPRARVRARS